MTTIANSVEGLLSPSEIAAGSLLTVFGLFAGVELFILKQVWLLYCPPKQASTSISFSGEKTRSFFIIFLAIANLFRTISLLWVFVNPQCYDEGVFATGSAVASFWAYTLLQSLPSLMFLSTYSVIILFFAQVYYTANWVNLPFLRPAFCFINAAVYLMVAVVTFLTHVLHSYGEFRVCSAVLIGTLYTLTAIAFAFYGFKVAFQFSGDGSSREQELRKTAVVRRVLALSVFCPLAFLTRGLYDFALAFGVLPPHGAFAGQLAITWESLVILLSEWVPATLVLFSFWPRHNTRVTSGFGGEGGSAWPSASQQAPLLGQEQRTIYLAAPTALSADPITASLAPSSVYPLGAVSNFGPSWKSSQ